MAHRAEPFFLGPDAEAPVRDLPSFSFVGVRSSGCSRISPPTVSRGIFLVSCDTFLPPLRLDKKRVASVRRGPFPLPKKSRGYCLSLTDHDHLPPVFFPDRPTTPLALHLAQIHRISTLLPLAAPSREKMDLERGCRGSDEIPVASTVP